MKNLVLILFLSIFPLLGCSAAAIILPAASIATTGVITWKRGEATKYYEYETDIVYRATVRALEDLGIPINSLGRNTIRAGGQDRFRIKLESAGPNISRLMIRVNVMGDKPYAELIYEKVDEQINIIPFTQ